MAWSPFSSRPETLLCFSLFAAMVEDSKQWSTFFCFAPSTPRHGLCWRINRDIYLNLQTFLGLLKGYNKPHSGWWWGKSWEKLGGPGTCSMASPLILPSTMLILVILKYCEATENNTEYELKRRGYYFSESFLFQTCNWQKFSIGYARIGVRNYIFIYLLLQ